PRRSTGLVDGPRLRWIQRISTSQDKPFTRGASMESHQDRTIQAYRRVDGYFATNKEFTAPGAGSTKTPALAAQVDALHGIVVRASDYAAEQNTQASQSLLISKDERELRREVLAQHMGTIAKVAR